MRMPALLALGLMASFLLLPTKPSESKLYFDAELRFNPPSDVRLHYAQFSRLAGTEISFGDYQEVGGQILSIYDEVVASNSSGVIEYDVEFQTYDPSTEVSFSTPPEPTNPFFGGGGGAPGGFDAPAPAPGINQPGIAPTLTPLPSLSGNTETRGAKKDGLRVPTPLELMPEINAAWRASQQRYGANFGPGYARSTTGGMMPAAFGQAQPMQRGGGGEGGEGGGGDGGGGEEPTAGAEDEDEFEVSPILETNLNYSIAQNGRLLNFTGLDIIGDIVNPRRNITVRQFWQTSHFLTLPDGPIHVGESWKGPMFWNVPFVGETVEVPVTYTLEGIETMERFRCAVISYTGLKQFEMTTLDENLERRIESDIMGDITIGGSILFDIDRGVIVAMASDLNAKRPSVLQGGFPIASQAGWGFFAVMQIDRLDTNTPLGNVLDTEPTETHKLQELTWVTTSVME